MNYELTTIGGGCFWCIEAVFQNLIGVEKVESGYMGGHVDQPTYREICTGTTGHAEIAQIHFDQDVITFEEILEVFWSTHDPTTLNRQGADRGTQYRSAIFYHSEEQKSVAEKSKKEVGTQLWSDPIVTEISPAETFFKAENYHQNYFNNNQYAGYCRIVIQPKLQKFKEKFAHKIKAES